MKTAKVLAVVGAVLIIISFFLPWQQTSLMGITVKFSGWGLAKGSPGGNYSSNPFNQPSDEAYLESFWDELLFGTSGQGESDSIAMLNNVINQMMAQPILFIFPAIAIFVILFSLLSLNKSHISYGLILMGVSVVLQIIAGVIAKKVVDLNNYARMAGSIVDMFGLGEFMPKSSLGIGVWGTIVGLLMVLVAGILDWRTVAQSGTSSSYSHSSAYQQYPQFNAKHDEQLTVFPQQYPHPNTNQQPSNIGGQYPAWDQPVYPPQQTQWQQPSQPSAWSQSPQQAQNTQYSSGIQGFSGQNLNQGNQISANFPEIERNQSYSSNNSYQQTPPSAPAPSPKDRLPEPNHFGAPVSNKPVSGWRTIKKPGENQPDN